MITFEWIVFGRSEKVFLEKKHVGTIKRITEHTGDCFTGAFVGWKYFPIGNKDGGEIFKNLSDCEKSLKEE